LYTGNRADAVLTQLAVHLIGCRIVFIPPELSASERVSFVRRSEAVAFVSDPAIENSAETARLVEPRLAFSLGPTGIGEDLLALAARMPAIRPEPCATSDEISTLFYTGGSTGRPKMVLHHHPYYDGLIYSGTARKAETPHPHRFLVCTPISHTSGHNYCLMALLAEGSVILLDQFEAAKVIAITQRESITSIFLVPPMLYELLDHPELPATGLPSLARLNYGGTPANPFRIQQALHRLGPVMRQVYGMTEVSVMTVLEPADHDESVPGRLTSCGRPLARLVEVSVRDEADAEVPVGEVGEVCARGPLVMAEYWKDPETTERTLRDGWMHTGDLGRFDAEGFLHLVDRINGVIITGRTSAGIHATNVYSQLLEDVLSRHPGIRSAAAVGLPDPTYGEGVHVACAADPAVPIDIAELKKRVVDELGEVYEPVSVALVDSLPVTAVGKIDKKAVRRMLESRGEQST
jgi:fatty-acyl-CoA synthase